MKGRGRKRGGPGGGGMHNLVRQANQMQTKMKKLQEELAEKEYTGTSGGGAVTVVVKGENTIHSIQIDPEIFKEGDAEMLQDMITTAANDALTSAKKDNEEQMEKITGPMNIPGVM